jgi:hypothetical protein
MATFEVEQKETPKREEVARRLEVESDERELEIELTW